MTMCENKRLVQDIKRMCEIWLKHSEEGAKKMKGDNYWVGYHNGQKRLAEHILGKINGTE